MPPKKKAQKKVPPSNGGEKEDIPSPEGGCFVESHNIGKTTTLINVTTDDNTSINVGPSTKKGKSVSRIEGRGGKKGIAKKSSQKSSSEKSGQKKSPPELLIAAAAAAAKTDCTVTTEIDPPPNSAIRDASIECPTTEPGGGSAAGTPARKANKVIQPRTWAPADLLTFQRMYKQVQPKEVVKDVFASSSSDIDKEEEDDVVDYPFDTALFADEIEELEDLSYYRNEGGTGQTGRKLLSGGPPKPDTSKMGEMEAEQVIKEWRRERKKYTDGLALQKRKTQLLGDENTFDEALYTGVLADKMRLMTQVEESPMKVGHNYPNKELVLLRIAEEANLSGCMISIGRSCTKRVIATGARDNHKFYIKVLYSFAHSWKVEVCDTYPEPIPAANNQNEKDDEEDDRNDDNALVLEEGNPDDDDNDDNEIDEDDEGGSGELVI